MKNNLAIRVPIFFSLYIAITIGVLKVLPDSWPVLVSNLFSLSYFVFLPLALLLKPLGLWSGEFWSGPTTLGWMVGLIIYDVILFLIIRWLQKLFQKSDRRKATN